MLRESTVIAERIRVFGIVQGVGFRPFVYRLARRYGLHGWVRNGGDGVDIVVEADASALEAFARDLECEPPAAARIARIERETIRVHGYDSFEIMESEASTAPTVRISPDLPVCEECLRELRDNSDRRADYPYINCTNCGPRYSIITALPYDRPKTTMASWPMCARCEAEYEDPLDRRFHAQPVACPSCGPEYVLEEGESRDRGARAIARTAQLLCAGAIVALKGIGGYHLACDARNATAVTALRERKYRKERPFAVMVRTIDVARTLIDCTPRVEALLASVERPIVLAPALEELAGVAPDNNELGVMLPYAPLHHLLFDAGAPDALVMTSGNRSSEPIAYDDDDARERLGSLADAMLRGERAIARRIDDSVVRAGPSGTMLVRHARGFAPRCVAALRSQQPIVAVGGDLKNTIVVVVDGQAFASQYIGDLSEFAVFSSFTDTVSGLCAMYGITPSDAVVAHDAHPQYRSTEFARAIGGVCIAVQHHRAHVASVLAERNAFDVQVVGLACDGTGYGDDGTIWGGEVFTGRLAGGLVRAASLLPAWLPGGDAAAHRPVVAAAGFLDALGDPGDMTAEPFAFPPEFRMAQQLLAHGIRAFRTTSVGRLFDAMAALLGFTRPMTFEGQAAIWLEHLARRAQFERAYAMPYRDGTIDYRPLLASVIDDRRASIDAPAIARGFHTALANAFVTCADAVGPGLPVVASGGVFQNALLVEMLFDRLGERVWLNERVPPNDGGIALGQAAIASYGAVTMSSSRG